MIYDEVVTDLATLLHVVREGGAGGVNDWTNEHVAGYQPRSVAGFGSALTGPGLGIDVDESRLGEPLFSAS